MKQEKLPGALRRPNQYSSIGFIWLSAPIVILSISLLTSYAAEKTFDDAQDPRQLIQAMSESLRSLSYEGTFVTVSGSTVDTLKIIQINNGVAFNQQLVSLNGESREVFRNNELVTCIWPNSQSVITMKARERKSETGYDFKLNNNYEYKLLSDDRVAGRQTFVVEVTANDRERYSYRVWIDKETKLLLKSMSLEAGGLPVEQVMFTDIRFDHDITIDNVTDKLERLEYQAQNYVEPASVSYLTEKKVRFDLLPKGYRKISEMNHHMPTIAEPVRHIFLSDGIASISIYVQFGYKASEIIPVGYAKLGSITAYERRTDTDLITVMGDVPAQTVRAVAYSVNIEN